MALENTVFALALLVPVKSVSISLLSGVCQKNLECK
jgi:hypothetical protein